jgi:simple sugar transport system ATP-binding protein
MPVPAPALELREVTKRYPGVLANDRVSLRVEPGTVHALVGENGAGKSTLAHVAYGMVAPDSGEVRIGGAPLGRGGPAEAMALGLGMVHQHFMLVPTLTVAENVVLGREPRKGAWFDRAAAERRVAVTAERFGLRLDPSARVESLSVGELQRVEIVKVLDRGARTLILDEPTAVLTPQEVEDLFRILRGLVAEGHSVLLISHRLPEVLSLAETITVMRDGRVVGEVRAREASEAGLARLIVGRDLVPVSRRRPAPPGDVVLSLEVVTTRGGRSALHDVSLGVRAGEVLGVAGVEGNGQRALVHAILGLEPLVAGRILLLGRDLAPLGTAERRGLGLGCVPEDRLGEGLVPELRLDENLVLGAQRDPALGRGPWLDPARLRAHAMALLERYDVRPARPELAAAALSGGNQQKLVMARELSRDPQLLVLAQPTRGVDVGGIEFIHARILEARDAGRAVLLVSADLNEVLALADRIAVLFEGRIVGTLPVEQADALRLGLLMTGSMKEPA